jgi:hypothetical protein
MISEGDNMTPYRFGFAIEGMIGRAIAILTLLVSQTVPNGQLIHNREVIDGALDVAQAEREVINATVKAFAGGQGDETFPGKETAQFNQQEN